MDEEKLKKIFFEVLRVVAAVVILYCIWEVVKVQVLYFQEDGPRFGIPGTSGPAAEASAPASAAPEVSVPAAASGEAKP